MFTTGPIMSSDFEPFFSLAIDKISLTCNDTNPDQVQEVCDRLLDSANRPFSGIHIKSGRRHRLQCAIPIPNSTGSFLMQAGSRHSDISDYRFECNPAIIGPEGLSYASSFINSVIDMGANALFANGKVTRIDIALDLLGLSLEHTVVRSRGQWKHAVFTDGKGRIESIYLGSVKANRTVVYKKTRGDCDFLRVERRMKPNIRGSELFRLPNPFDKVQMISTNSLIPHLGGMIPSQFFDSVRMRGIGHVIAELPPRQRRAIKQVLADPEESLLPSMPLVWNVWPHVLNGCGLGALCQSIGRSEAAE
jgi:hypothetical protein